jgi:hypothetical protein
MYDPTQGRFLSMDPLPRNGIDILYEHPFVYARNNPTNRVDPSGQLSIFPVFYCDIPTLFACGKLNKEPGCKGLRKRPIPDPKKNPKLYGLAYCSKGVVKVDFYEPRRGDPRRGDKCFKKCVLEHEAYHQKQIAAWCPWLCKCYPKETFDIGYTKFDGGKTERRWECPAHIVFLLCIKKKLDEIAKGKNPDKCDKRALILTQQAQIQLLGQLCQLKIPPFPPAPKNPS